MKNIHDFIKMKKNEELISFITCYDYWSARIINETNIDAILVGDSVSMVMHGYETTINADINMLELHVKAVRRGAKDKFIVADMPFLAHKKGIKNTMNNVDILMKAGANAIKVEGAEGQLDILEYIIKSGVPVMGHLGLTPQSINIFGGYKVQAKEETEMNKLLSSAISLQDVGCFSIVLELVPSSIAKKITEQLNIPTIGIGAGPDTSGQVLVLHDMLGLNKEFKPKFLREYLNGFELIKTAIENYDNEVKSKKFPTEKESY
ncbi:MAG: 3-methyl-2-oxobutanoate hydroxymethyltransferase [Ignavibacteriales bacterium]|nr:3-methyl-2-oxobutanoate hydroxymethyltransferase [Ignavibacteriales bacterium]